MKLRTSLVLVSLFSTVAVAQMQPMPAASTQPAATQPTTNPADTAAVLDALGRYNKAVQSGDANAIEGLLQLSGEPQKQMIGIAKTLIEASHGLYQTTLEKFGKESLDQNNIAKEQFPNAFPELPLEQAKVKVEGDKAAVRFGPDEAGPAVLSLVKSGDTWKIAGDALLGPVTEQQVKDQTSVIGAVVGAMNKTRDDIKAGHIAAPDEVVLLWKHRVEKAVQEAQMKRMQAELPPAPAPGNGPATAPAGPELP